MEAQVSFYDVLGFYLFLLGIAGALALPFAHMQKSLLSAYGGRGEALAIAVMGVVAALGIVQGARVPHGYEVILQPDEELVAKAVDDSQNAKVMTRRAGKLHVRHLYVPKGEEVIVKKIDPNYLLIVE